MNEVPGPIDSQQSPSGLPRPAQVLGGGGIVFAAALLICWVLRTLAHSQLATGGAQRAASLVSAALAAMILVPMAAYLVGTARRADAHHAAWLVVASVAVGLIGVFLYAVADAVLFRGDFLLWSEGDFVADALKFKIHHPLYTAPANLESFTYTPASPLVTSLIARVVGFDFSIPAFRIIQLGFTGLAAVFAGLATRRLVGQLGSPAVVPWLLRASLWVAVLFLIAVNLITNPYTYKLHNDALTLLISAIAYWVLVEYAATGRTRWLVAMALVPGVGFLVKQSLAIWAGLYLVYLVVFDRRLRVRSVALFAAGAFGSAAAAAGLCYLAWGQNFWYWAVTVLGHHPVVPLRSVQHLLDSWIYFAVLLLGGLALLRADRLDRWTGVWVVALGLITVETYTSGVAWMLNHIGPGSLLAGCWLLVGLERIAMASRPAVGSATARWFQSGAVAALIGLTFAGLGVVRVPAPTLSPDTERYAAEIEREFVGMPAAEVLLDVGQWVYLPDRVIMRDRGATSGEAGYTGTADFSGMLARIGGKHYRRILLRDYDSPEFMYDHGDWAKSSGIRSALNANYQVVRRIEAVQGPRDSPWFKTISVLEPRPPATAGH